MTEILVDKHFDTEGTSSALNAVYYSTDERKIFFEFLSGTLAGYEGVNPDIFTALETLNANRINGDESASVGTYYNTYFRNTGYFAGVETNDLDLITPWQAELREPALNSKDVFADEGINLSEDEQVAVEPIEVKEGSVFIAPLNNKTRYGITFIVDTDNEHSFQVFGDSEDDAVNRFSQAVELLGWSVEIRSVTRFLY